MRRDLINAFIAVIVFTALCGFVYPMFITGVSQVVFKGKADGSLIKRDGQIVGSAIIGQQFYAPVIGRNGKPETVKGVAVMAPDPRYFQTRPSGEGAPYVTGGTADNAAGTEFSNAGPNDLSTKQDDLYNINVYMKLEKPYDPTLTVAQIPPDAVQSSASGVDPDISVANADIQAHRIASVRHLSLAEVHKLISQYTNGNTLGFMGEPGVDVLEINLALDRLTGSK
jgi:potassium-transporting ATPase KdpC subunit